VPRATAAASQIVGLPVQAIITDHWKPKQAAMSGHAHGAGRCQAMTAPTMPSGISHHRIAGRNDSTAKATRAGGG
jgi:hypothetical protein